MHAASARSKLPCAYTKTTDMVRPFPTEDSLTLAFRAGDSILAPRVLISTCGFPLRCRTLGPRPSPFCSAPHPRRVVPGAVAKLARARTAAGRGVEAHQEPGRYHQRKGRERRQSQGPRQGWRPLRGARRRRGGAGSKCGSHSGGKMHVDQGVRQTLHGRKAQA